MQPCLCLVFKVYDLENIEPWCSIQLRFVNQLPVLSSALRLTHTLRFYDDDWQLDFYDTLHKQRVRLNWGNKMLDNLIIIIMIAANFNTLSRELCRTKLAVLQCQARSRPETSFWSLPKKLAGYVCGSMRLFLFLVLTTIMTRILTTKMVRRQSRANHDNKKNKMNSKYLWPMNSIRIGWWWGKQTRQPCTLFVFSLLNQDFVCSWCVCVWICKKKAA